MIGITKSVCKNKLLYDYNVQSVVCVSLRVYYTVEIKKKKKTYYSRNRIWFSLELGNLLFSMFCLQW